MAIIAYLTFHPQGNGDSFPGIDLFRPQGRSFVEISTACLSIGDTDSFTPYSVPTRIPANRAGAKGSRSNLHDVRNRVVNRTETDSSTGLYSPITRASHYFVVSYSVCSRLYSHPVFSCWENIGILQHTWHGHCILLLLAYRWCAIVYEKFFRRAYVFEEF